MKMKKLLAAVMAAVMLYTLCACGAAETTLFKMKKYRGDDGYTCLGFKSERDASLQVTIPAEYKSEAVQYVGSSAFAESDLYTAKISEGIEGIQQYAFRDCACLEAVSLPQSLTDIGMAAFSKCTALKEIHIPKGVTDLEMWAFVNCSALETVVIEGQLTRLERESFRDCASLKVIYLPETLTTIEPDALDGCNALEEIHFAGTVEEFQNIDFIWDWMSAENVLLCCSDGNVLLENRSTWYYTDRQPYYPADPMDALAGFDSWIDLGPDETMPGDQNDPGPDETTPDGGESEPAEFVNTSRTTQAIAPYHAIAMEHDGYIYYFDDNANLCRADSNMNSFELFCDQPLGTCWDQDDHTVNIIGISDTDVMYITGIGRSFAVDLASGQIQELLTGTPGEKVRLYGMSGEWIYYTRSNASENTLYRSGLSDGFTGEEAIISNVLGDLREIYVTDTYLIYVLDEGRTWSLYCAPLMDPQVPIWRDGGGGEYPTISLVGADGVMAVYYKKGSDVLRGNRFYACDLASGNITGGGALRIFNCTYDGDSQCVYFFEKYLSFIRLEDLAESVSYSARNRYENEKISAWRITPAGNWLFFRRDFRGGGADCCINSDGITFINLRDVI